MVALWLPACIHDRIHNAKPGECMWDPSLNTGFVIMLAILGYDGSCILMLFCYFKVFIFMRKRGRIMASEGDARIHKVAISGINANNKTTSRVCTQNSQVSSSQPSMSLPLSQQITGNQKKISSTSFQQHDVDVHESVPHVQSDVERRQKRDRAVFVTLTYVVVGYAVTWIPFHFVFIISSVCPFCISRDVYELVFWTSYCNSTINPFLYYISTPEFRRTFKKLLCRR